MSMLHDLVHRQDEGADMGHFCLVSFPKKVHGHDRA